MYVCNVMHNQILVEFGPRQIGCPPMMIAPMLIALSRPTKSNDIHTYLCKCIYLDLVLDLNDLALLIRIVDRLPRS